MRIPAHLLPPLSRLPRSATLQVELGDEICRVVTALQKDQDTFLLYWNSMRLRDPMLQACAATWHARTVEDLLRLTPRQHEAVDAFHRELDALRDRVTYTDAMPATLRAELSRATARLTALADTALELLDGREPPWAPAD